MGLISMIGKQAQHPNGLLGKLLFRVMTRMTLAHSRWTIEQMDVQQSDQVLDIGFGNGASVELLARSASQGHVTGAEVSRTAIDMAAKRNAKTIADGLVTLVEAKGRGLPFDDGAFDKVCTINTVYVIEEPGAVFEEMFRVLKPGGLAAVTFPVRENFMKFRPTKTEGFHLHELADLESAFRNAGFTETRTARNDAMKFGGHCITGRK